MKTFLHETKGLSRVLWIVLAFPRGSTKNIFWRRKERQTVRVHWTFFLYGIATDFVIMFHESNLHFMNSVKSTFVTVGVWSKYFLKRTKGLCCHVLFRNSISNATRLHYIQVILWSTYWNLCSIMQVEIQYTGGVSACMCSRKRTHYHWAHPRTDPRQISLSRRCDWESEGREWGLWGLVVLSSNG